MVLRWAAFVVIKKKKQLLKRERYHATESTEGFLLGEKGMQRGRGRREASLWRQERQKKGGGQGPRGVLKGYS